LISTGVVGLLLLASAAGTKPEACDRKWQLLSMGPVNGDSRQYDFYWAGASDHKSVWAVGSRRKWAVVSPGKNALTQYPLVGYWGGARWREKVLTKPGQLYAVATYGQETWALSERGWLHRTGRRSTVEAAPGASTRYDDVAVTADGTFWAVTDALYRRERGAWRRLSSERDADIADADIARGPDGTLWATLHSDFKPDVVARWRGRWVPTILPKLRDPWLRQLAAAPDGTAFVVGEDNKPGSYNLHDTEALVLYWDRNSWTRLKVPNASGYAVESVAAASRDNFWITVFRLGDFNDQRILRYDSGTWSKVPLPDHPQAGATYAGDLVLTGDDLWVVSRSVQRYAC
jgi:hypothetical protein